ncbi:hypothetical protein BJ322DRAFT_380751 [Thelephora terrestris]|uniref:DUF6533 domain-containing protein n=1 Tax=Thelephora terrestris TaxID=56493 RepID=A0A9P6HLP4_9AGAM|nr:hypothetical protein BJ322DRAFT_380751 [Thelephora terrestris]
MGIKRSIARLASRKRLLPLHTSMASYDGIGFDVTITKYGSLALGAVLFYDYLLTLQDEVRYVWGGKKSWVFCLFLTNRYVSLIYEVWVLVAFNFAGYTGKMSVQSQRTLFHQLKFDSCKETVRIQVAFFVYATLLAQVLFVAQVYALSGRNRKVLAAAFQICILDTSVTFNARAAYTIFSLAYNVASLLTLLRLSYLTCGPSSTWPVVLKTMIKDSALYFVVVFTSHSLGCLFMTLNASSVKTSSYAVVNVLIPVMVSRIVLNLRKSNDQATNAHSEWASRLVSFAPNHELTVRTQTRHQATFPGSGSRGTSFHSDTL